MNQLQGGSTGRHQSRALGRDFLIRVN